MSAIVLEVAPRQVNLNEELYSDRDSSFIYEHLKYYCSKFSPLPAIMVAVHHGNLVITQGHKYLRIATELERTSIRAILTGDMCAPETQGVLARKDVRVLSWQQLRKEEEEQQVIDAFHVFFFETAISDNHKVAFENKIAGFFRNLKSMLVQPARLTVTSVGFSHDDYCAEFVATTPAGDSSWFGDFHATCLDFSRRNMRILSYQGRRFLS